MNRILHICNVDKFTIPFYEFIVNELKLKNHFFIYISDNSSDNRIFSKHAEQIKTPNKKHLLRHYEL